MTATRATAGRSGWAGCGLALALLLALLLAMGGSPPCRIVPAADALDRLAVWGRELAGARGPVAAHSARQVAWVADRGGRVLEALVLVTLQEVRGSGPNPGAGASSRRARWVRCTSGIAEGRNADGTRQAR